MARSITAEPDAPLSTFPDLVVFLPGIAGSTLRRGDELLWGMDWRSMRGALLGGGLDRLSIPHDDGSDALDDGIEAEAVVDSIQIIPGLWKIEQYGGFCAQLRTSVGLVEGANFLRFPYDWRRDNRVSAGRLARFAAESLRRWRKTSGNADAKIVFVCHSMGGLVARYYVECLEGWRSTRRVFTIGTPHRGSLDALGYLANGYAKSIGPVSLDATRPLRSFASVHQLLPTFACVGEGAGLSRVGDLDIPNVSRERVADAMCFHQEITAAAATNQMQEGYDAQHLSTIASNRQPTFQSARLTATGLELVRSIRGDDNGGDGTVPLVSATPTGIDYGRTTYVWGVHAALCNQEALVDHVVAALRTGRIEEDIFRDGTAAPQVQMMLPDACVADEAFEITATVPGPYEQTLAVSTSNADGGAGPETTLHRDGDRLVGTMRLPEGAWRIRVEGRRNAAVEDVMLAVAPVERRRADA